MKVGKLEIQLHDKGIAFVGEKKVFVIGNIYVNYRFGYMIYPFYKKDGEPVFRKFFKRGVKNDK